MAATERAECAAAGARIGPLKAGYPGASASAMFRLEAARDKALAMVEALDAEMDEGGDD